MKTAIRKSLPLFGPPRAWLPESEFTASDDRVRGGSSRSTLEANATRTSVRFHGTLDTTTLGGAGFASQRTTSTTQTWNLSDYAGLELRLGVGDGKRYTLNLKTCLPDKMRDNPARDASTVEYAYTFVGAAEPSKLFVAWDQFEAFYRGRKVDDAPPLDTAGIRRWSIMIRSFFEDQKSGDFSLVLRSIKARTAPSRQGESDSEPELDEGDLPTMDGKEAKVDRTIKLVSEKPRKNNMIRFCSIL